MALDRVHSIWYYALYFVELYTALFRAHEGNLGGCSTNVLCFS